MCIRDRLWIGCPVGTYMQISINWHAYLNTLEKVKSLRPDRMGYIENPYDENFQDHVRHDQMFHGDIADANDRIQQLLYAADHNFLEHLDGWKDDEPFFNAAYSVLRAHEFWRVGSEETRYTNALGILRMADQRNDWVVAATQWIERRYEAWKMRFVLSGDASHP